jgi:predicted metal-binding protein
LSECEEGERLAELCRVAVSLGAEDARVIEAKEVVVGNWVRLKCQYGCDGYGRSLACPPFSPTPEEFSRVLGEYRHAILVRIEPPDLSEFSLFCHDLMLRLEREAFLRGHYKAFALATDGCPYCEECNLESCIHPEKLRPSMEGCGIDVFATGAKAGYKIGVCKGRDAKPSFYGLLLVE